MRVMRPGGESRLLGVDRLLEKRLRRAEDGGAGAGRGGENAEVVDDMNGFTAEGERSFSAAGYEMKSVSPSSAAGFSPNRRFTGAWKPVIDGKIQFPSELPNSSGEWPSPKQQQPPQAGGSERPSVSNISGSSDMKKDDEGYDSDSEFRRVPELPEKKKSHPHKRGGSASSSRKRPGASSNEKEGKRLKRLLRNRVSAQQARERKKAYLIELEQKAKELESRNAELEEKNGTLQRENYMLRQIVKNTTMRSGGGDLAS